MYARLFHILKYYNNQNLDGFTDTHIHYRNKYQGIWNHCINEDHPAWPDMPENLSFKHVMWNVQ